MMDNTARTKVNVISNPCPARDHSTRHLLHLQTPTHEHPGKTRSTRPLTTPETILRNTRRDCQNARTPKLAKSRRRAVPGRLNSPSDGFAQIRTPKLANSRLRARPDTQTRELTRSRSAWRSCSDARTPKLANSHEVRRLGGVAAIAHLAR